MEKVVRKYTVDELKAFAKKKAEEEKISPQFWCPVLDKYNGCPDIPPKQKILRYLKALKIYDDSSCIICNSAFNDVCRNAKKYLTQKEFSKLLNYMVKDKVGDVNRQSS